MKLKGCQLRITNALYVLSGLQARITHTVQYVKFSVFQPKISQTRAPRAFWQLPRIRPTLPGAFRQQPDQQEAKAGGYGSGKHQVPPRPVDLVNNKITHSGGLYANRTASDCHI
jgi:hypothetical protein